MPASNTRTAGGRGWICPSSRPTRRAMTSFSLHVLTKRRYFWRLSKKRKLLSGSAFCPAAAAGRGAPPWMSAISSGGASPAPDAPCFTMKSLTRVRVSGVTRAPSRRRATNLPSFTARRPKVDSAMPVRRQKSEMLPSSVPPPPACTASSVTELRENLARAISGTATTPLAARKLGYCPSRKINGFHSRPNRQYPLIQAQHLDTGGAHLFLKLETHTPGGSIKARVALSMIEAAEREGHTPPGSLIVEATAGNTGLGLALVA